MNSTKIRNKEAQNIQETLSSSSLDSSSKTSKNHGLKIAIGFFILIFSVYITVFLCLYTYDRSRLGNSHDLENKNSFYRPSESQFIPVIENLMDEEGAYFFRGKMDIPNSRYYKPIDIYNMKSSGSLILLEKFKTYQQTSSYSCGCASLIMAIYHLDGTVIGEKDCSTKAKSVPVNGTLPVNLEAAISQYGYDYESKRRGFNGKEEIPSYDPVQFSRYIKSALKNNESLILLSNDWGGHYTVAIGYDDMGTETLKDDVIIIADPFDTSDHINDGYTLWSYERLYALMEVEVFHIKDNHYEFIKVKRKS